MQVHLPRPQNEPYNRCVIAFLDIQTEPHQALSITAASAAAVKTDGLALSMAKRDTRKARDIMTRMESH